MFDGGAVGVIRVVQHASSPDEKQSESCRAG